MRNSHQVSHDVLADGQNRFNSSNPRNYAEGESISQANGILELRDWKEGFHLQNKLWKPGSRKTTAGSPIRFFLRPS